MSTNTNLKAYVKYDKQGYLVPGGLSVNRKKPAIGDWEEIPYTECCSTPPTQYYRFILLFDEVANAPVANPSDYNEWNTFFGITDFVSVFIAPTGEIYLKSTSTITITASLFNNNLNLIKIIDDEGAISGIGDYTFDGCSNLESVSLSSVKDVSSYAFRNCTGLNYININDTNNLTIYDSGFEGANIPTNFPFEKIIRLYPSSFKNCTGITSVNIINSNNSSNLGDFCFSGSTITSITIPLSSAGYGAGFGIGVFQGCTSLQSFEIGYSIQDIPLQMFDGCTNLSTLIFENPVTDSISQYAFRNCTSLTGIYFSQVQQVGDNAFENCTSVTSIYLPLVGRYSSVIGSDAADNNVFLGITGKTINAVFNQYTLSANGVGIPDGDIAYLLANNTVTYTSTECMFIAFDSLATISSLVPTYNNVASWNTFFDLPANGTAFSSVNVFSPASSFPNEFPTVSLFGGANINVKASLFENVSGLRYIIDTYFSGRITSVSNNAFRNTGLLSAQISGVITLGNRAFQGCSYWNPSYISGYITENFPSLISLGDYCFEGLGNLTPAYVGAINIVNGSAYSISSVGEYCFANSKVGTTVILSAITSLGKYTFQNCTSLGSVEINAVSSIGDGAFAGCTNLYSIKMKFCEYLGSTTGDNGVFAGITGNSITLYIQQDLFTVNGGLPDGDLTYLQSNNTLNVINTTVYTRGLALEFDTAANALAFFGGTINASSVNTKFATVGNAVPFSNIKIFKVGRLVICSNGGNISIPNGLFSGNTHIISIVDGPDQSKLSVDGDNVNFSIVNIGDDAFNGCTNLTTARFQTAVNYGARAFKNCTSLSSLNLQHAYTFGNNCFENCTSLTSFNYVRDLISVGNYAFAGCTSVTDYDFPALATIGDYAFYNNTSVANINIPYCTNLGTSTGNNNVFTGISGNVISLIIPATLDTDSDIIALQTDNFVYVDRPSLQLIFTNKAAADALTSGNSTIPSNWNTFFNLPTNGTPFTSVLVTENVPIIRPEYITYSYDQQYGCEVKLYGGGNMTIPASRFVNYRNLRKVIDNGNTVVRINNSAFRQTSVSWYSIAGYTGYTPIEVSFPACTFMEQLAFQSSFGGYFVNFPRLTYISGQYALGGIFNLFQNYGPVIYKYYDTVVYTASLPNVISMGGQAIFANNSCRSINLPQQTSIPTFTFATCMGQINMPAATSTGDQIWWKSSGLNVPTQVVNMPLVTVFGTTVGNNNQWGGYYPISGAYRINPFLMTNNAGGPDGDVLEMQTATVPPVIYLT